VRLRGRRRAAVRIASLAIAVSVLSGCSASAEPEPTAPPVAGLDEFDASDGNGLWLLAGDEIVGEIIDAVREAGPVRVSGSVTELVQPDPTVDPARGRTIAVDFHGRADAFTATVTGGALETRVIVDDGTSRVRSNEAAAAALGAPALAGAVVCSVGADPVIERWAPLLAPVDLIETLLTRADASVAPPTGEGETLDVVLGTDEAPLGVLTVERFGPPLPRSFTAADASGDGVFQFTEWGVMPDLAGAAAELPCPEGD
jgi:hypothetical protein